MVLFIVYMVIDKRPYPGLANQTFFYTFGNLQVIDFKNFGIGGIIIDDLIDPSNTSRIDTRKYWPDSDSITYSSIDDPLRAASADRSANSPN